MPSAEQLVEFYDSSYSAAPDHAQLYARWRALGAVGKADHVASLCAAAGLHPRRVLDVGCGDGALLCELARRRLGDEHDGLEITDVATALARQRPEISSVATFDGAHVPAADGAYDLGILSHVLEHVTEPVALLAEVARTCHAVVVEVPLEANLSARRAAKRAGAEEVGHLQSFDRSAARTLVGRAGLRVAAELDDPLPLAVQTFFAHSRRARAAGTIKWAVRTGTYRLAPPLARRLYTLHYAALALPADSAG